MHEVSLTFVQLHVIYFYVVFLVSLVKTEKEKNNIKLVLSTWKFLFQNVTKNLFYEKYANLWS